MNLEKYILSNIKSRQVIITGCDKGVFENTDECNFIYIKDGKKEEPVFETEEIIEQEANME